MTVSTSSARRCPRRRYSPLRAPGPFAAGCRVDRVDLCGPPRESCRSPPADCANVVDQSSMRRRPFSLDNFHQRHQVRRIPEMRRQHPLRRAAAGRNGRNTQARGVGRQHRVRRRQGVHAGKPGSCFQARSSGPDSTTRSASRSTGRNRWSRRAVAEPAPRLRRRPGRWRSASGATAPGLFPALRAAASAVRLSKVTRTPPRARVRAIPGPIIPVPTTLAVANLVCGIAAILPACARPAIVTRLIKERLLMENQLIFVLARSTRCLEQ